jgi:hypothetical protein
MNYSNITSRIEYGNLDNGGLNAYNDMDDFTSSYSSTNPNNNLNNNQNNFRNGDDNRDKQYKLYQEIGLNARSQNNYEFRNDKMIMKGYFNDKENNELAKIFFSKENIKRIQKKLREEMLIKSKGKIKLDAEQDESDMLVCMRAIFLEHGRFLPFQLVKQVKKLNEQVVAYILPDMISQIKQYYGYLKEINEPIKPIDRPINVNRAGRKTLPPLTSAWQI